MTKKAPQIPLDEVLTAIDKKDRNWYINLSDERRKAFSAWMMMRYCSSVQGRKQLDYLFFTNEFVNKNFMDISRHPELQWLLLTACGQGKKEYHQYIKPPNSRRKKNKVQEFLSEIYPHAKYDEIELMIELNSKEELKQFAKDYGYDDKQIKEIFGK